MKLNAIFIAAMLLPEMAMAQSGAPVVARRLRTREPDHRDRV
jgi:hypothetical protein